MYIHTCVCSIRPDDGYIIKTFSNLSLLPPPPSAVQPGSAGDPPDGRHQDPCLHPPRREHPLLRGQEPGALSAGGRRSVQGSKVNAGGQRSPPPPPRLASGGRPLGGGASAAAARPHSQDLPLSGPRRNCPLPLLCCCRRSHDHHMTIT